MRANADRVLAQGVTTAVAKAFAATRYSADPKLCWNAGDPHHLPLPRAVGPYTVIRVTKRFLSAANCVLLGPHYNTNNNEWTGVCAFESVNAAGNVGFTNNATQYSFPLTSSWGSASVVTPSAFSVQIMNPGALQTTNGIIYIGRCSVDMDMTQKLGITWADLFNTFVAYQAPRLTSAGKLALRGVRVDAIPLNMSKVADFTRLVETGNATTTWNGENQVTAWTPIFVFNDDAAPLEYLVTMEMRVRFDLANVASATHTLHPPASDGAWQKAIKDAMQVAHGVLDIADEVASVGARFRRALNGPIRQYPMIVD